jgi:hypothetical protein
MKNLRRLSVLIKNLDLDCIKVKIMESEEGLGWSRAQADAAEKLYKRFLFLSAISDSPIVPTKTIDQFWHFHILDTRKYAKDCDLIFGYFLHHFPYLGIRSADDSQRLQNLFETSCAIYRSTFDESYPDEKSASCTSPNCTSCYGCASAPTSCAEELIQESWRPSLKS